MTARLLSTQEIRSLKPSDQMVFEILLSHKVIPYSILRYLVDYMETWHTDPLSAVQETHLATEGAVADAFASSLKIMRIYNMTHSILATAHINCLPYQRARDIRAILIREDHAHDDEGVELVCSNPCATDVIQEIEDKLGFKPRLAVAETREIRRAIDELYPLSEQLSSIYHSHT